MKVNCPHCKAQYQVADQHFAAGDVTLNCPRCKQSFRATASHVSLPSLPAATIPPTAFSQAAPTQQLVPAPILTVPAAAPLPPSPVAAAPEPLPSSPQASAEWDSMMGGGQVASEVKPASQNFAPDNALDDFLPPELQVGLGQQSIAAPVPQAAVARDPFYEANPLIYEQPPADAVGQSAQSYRAQTAHNLATPSAPLSATPQAATAAALASIPPIPAPMPTANQSAAGPADFGLVTIQNPQAQLSSPPQRSSTDPFANISLTASATQSPAASDETENPFSTQPLKTGVSMAAVRSPTFPPRAALVEEKEQSQKVQRSWPTHLLLAVASIAFILALLFALWQFEKLPGEPRLTLHLAKIFGVTSVLQVQNPTAISVLLQEAKDAEDKESLALGASFYHQALKQDPQNIEARQGLQRCYKALGDHRAELELNH